MDKHSKCKNIRRETKQNKNQTNSADDDKRRSSKQKKRNPKTSIVRKYVQIAHQIGIEHGIAEYRQ